MNNIRVQIEDLLVPVFDVFLEAEILILAGRCLTMSLKAMLRFASELCATLPLHDKPTRSFMRSPSFFRHSATFPGRLPM